MATVALIHTTTMVATHAMYDLSAILEFFMPLIEEIEQQLDSEGNSNVTALNDIRKLDRLMKKSQRLNSLNLSMDPLPYPPERFKKKSHILSKFYSRLQPHRQRTRHPLRRRPPPPQDPLLRCIRPYPYGPNSCPKPGNIQPLTLIP